MIRERRLVSDAPGFKAALSVIFSALGMWAYNRRDGRFLAIR